MTKNTLKIIVAAGALTAITAPAFADGHCERCFRREVRPAVYGVVQQNVVVRPAQVQREFVPPQTAIVHQRVQVAPPRVVQRHVPAEVAVVPEAVQIAPARRVWTRTVDAHGREIACERTMPARYGVVNRHVVVRPARVETTVVPAQEAVVQREIVVRPGGYVTRVIPAEVHTIQRPVMIRPATEAWVPTRGGHHQRRHHHHHGW